MGNSATKYVIVRAKIGTKSFSGTSWVKHGAWSEGTLLEFVIASRISLNESYRETNSLADDVKCNNYLEEVKVFDNELPARYEQPPVLTAMNEPFTEQLSQLVDTLDRLVTIAKGGINLDKSIAAVEAKIGYLVADEPLLRRDNLGYPDATMR